MNTEDRAERALYATQYCGSDRVMKARGNVVARLFVGKLPRKRDVRTLERAASGKAHDWRKPRQVVQRNRIADAAVRIFEAIRAIPGGDPSCWRDVAVFLVGSAWGGMIVYGALLAIAARHAP